MVIDVEERNLVLLLPQHEEDRLDEFRCSENYEEPVKAVQAHHRLGDFVGGFRRVEAGPAVPEREAKLVCAQNAVDAGDHLIKIINSRDVVQLERFSVLHELRKHFQHHPQVEREDAQQRKRRVHQTPRIYHRI